MKLIIRAPNWVGDGVMALPAVDNARDITGADYIAVMARGATAPLYRNHPDVDRVIVIDDKSPRLIAARRAAKLIKDDRYNVGVILPPSFSSALIFKIGGVAGRAGYAGDRRSLLLTRAVKPPKEKTHRVRLYLYLFEELTGQKLDFRAPRLYLSREDITNGEKILAEYSLSYDDKYIAISPRAVAESRRWGVDNYGRLAARITSEMNCKVVLIGSKADFEAGRKVEAAGGANTVNLCGKTPLMTAAAILSFASLFIGNDSGLAHLAGAVDCSVVVLSGPDDPEQTSPMCEKKKVIIRDIDCISCIKNVCPKSGDDFMRCMKLIAIDEVFDAAKEIVKT
jgi:heptosyltransferase-2